MVSAEHQVAVRKEEPISWNGLTLFPIQVKDYDKFLIAQSGLTVSQQTLPGKYVVMRYLDALFALDYDVRMEGGPKGGFFSRVLLFLVLSLRLEVQKGENGEEYIPIGIRTEKENPRKLVALEVQQGSTVAEITSKNFNQLREILAAQNAVELPDESLNPDLVQAEKDLAAKGSINLVVDNEALVYSVSVQLQRDVLDIMEWTIRRFVLTERAIDRIKGHMITAMTEASGGKYKNGNPFPSWKYDRNRESSALISMDSVIGRLSGSVEMK